MLKIATDIYKDDRLFLIKLLSGSDIDNENEDYSITQHLEDLELSLEQELEITIHNVTKNTHQNIEVSFNSSVYHHLYKYITDIVTKKREQLLKVINAQSGTSIHKKVLQELTPELTLFSFVEYVSMIVDYILNNTYDKLLIFDIIKYLLVDYTPKNMLDVPYVRWSELDVMKTPGKGIKPIGFLYEDYRKWDSKRIELAKSVDKTKQILVVNDANWIWFNLLKESGKVGDNFSISNLTYNDVLVKEFLNHLLFKLTWKLLTTHIVYMKLSDEQLQRLTEIITYTEYVISTENKDKFTFSKVSSYLIPEQIKNQYMLKVDVEQSVDKNTISQLIDSLTDKIFKLKQELENINDKNRKRDLQNTIKLIEKTITELSQNKDNITLIKILPILVSQHTKKPQVTDVDIIDFMVSRDLVKKVEVIKYE